jgi:retron-type reverse transcriptase
VWSCDSLDPTVLLSILREKLYDNRFLRLLKNLFKAGYLEDWTYHSTLSGVPQGGVCSPILMNIYLDRLDQFVETVLLPLYNRGDRRKRYQPPMKQRIREATNNRTSSHSPGPRAAQKIISYTG